MTPFLKRVLITTIIAGTLDILAAYIQVYISTNHISTKMFNYIAGAHSG